MMQEVGERKTFFVDVLLPVPIPQLFTYRVPEEMNEYIATGLRVIVPFGPRRVLTAIIINIHHKAPEKYQAKYILDVLDEEPCVNPTQVKFWEWIASYYMCTTGEVMNIAIPSGLKLTSQSRIQLNPEFDFETTEIEFTPKEERLLEALKRADNMPYDKAAAILEVKNIYNILKFLIAKKAILIFEEVKEKYKPLKIKKVRLQELYVQSEESLEKLFEQLAKKPKQETLLLKYLSLVPIYSHPQANLEGIEKSKLLEQGMSPSSYKTLVKNGAFEEFEIIISRFDEYEPPTDLASFGLSEEQTIVRDKILDDFSEKNTVLLHGVTGSGKTEVYIDLISKNLENGNQVLFLLPEIALTAQIVGRLSKVFGKKMGVYHSRFSDNERVEVWKGVQDGTYNFIVGVRSSIFLPFDNLGLIIVDEEHEPSYKQYDPAPRYNARDAAMVLANFHHAKTLLGSATPSVESYYLARKGQYGFAELTQRYGDAVMPEIVLANTRLEQQQRKMKGDFSSVLLGEIERTVSEKFQVILFQNRRGYAPYLTCETCGWIPKCKQCSVSLTYHLYRNQMRCHYCGYSEPPIHSCAVCGSKKIKTVGLGTEKIEDELKLLLPTARIDRMDLDTTRKKNSYQQIISDFEQQNIDILVGTQMVTKGLDFDCVHLVGVFDIDRLIHFPDFRSHERAFQMMTQVSGRAGRRGRQGKVVIQTSSPEQRLLKLVVNGDYQSFFAREIQERKKFLYPPFTRIIEITLKSEDKILCQDAADFFTKNLAKQLGKRRVLGPEAPFIDRIRNQFLRNVMIKLERGTVNLSLAKELIEKEIDELGKHKQYKAVATVIDVDSI
ncbi:primosomal protein N' [Flammeovirgaceae bacterium SG7u.111]|nr:primosomal protein N' [Flammeovirgaceae bacterium SG7u.132]WPO35550.1 primosomal protein N' [Flammeovirgaceae bacterium SG7u.111]